MRRNGYATQEGLSVLFLEILSMTSHFRSKLDEMSKQQLYFLTVEPDDFQDMLKRPELPSSGSIDHPRSGGPSTPMEQSSRRSSLASNKSNQSATNSRPTSRAGSRSTLTLASPQKRGVQKSSRPFQFSDFAAAQPPRGPDSPNVSEDSDARRPSVSAVSEAVGSVAGASAAVVPDDEEVFRVTTQAEMDSMMSRSVFLGRN